jgi:hypothetical protein
VINVDVSNFHSWLPTILTAVVVILGMVGFSIKLKNASTELSHLFAAISASMADNKITPEELQLIIDEAKQVVQAMKANKTNGK